MFAIAITLLVLDLAVPAGAEGDLLHGFMEAWPRYLAYVVSFATIGAAWMAHAAITEYIDRADINFARLNLILLLLVSFLTFPTRLVGEHINEEGAERVAVTALGINLVLIVSLIYVLWRLAARNSLTRPDIDDEELRIITQRLTPGLGGYVLLIVLGLFFPLAAVFGYLALALLLLLPGPLSQRPRHRGSRSGDREPGEGSDAL